MCGIGVSIAQASECHKCSPLQQAWPSILKNINRRGPDFQNTIHHDFELASTNHASSQWTSSLTSSVLSLRGAGVTTQPLLSSDGRLALAWNGQIFDWNASNHATSSRVRLDAGENDGIILLDRIQELLAEPGQQDDKVSIQHALNAALAEIEGPYAFVLLDRHESKLYFGRDPLGRRSLLLYEPLDASALAIISVATAELLSNEPEASLTEVACSSLFTIDLLDAPASPKPLPRHTSNFTSRLLLRELRPSQPNKESASSLPQQDIDDFRATFLSVLAESVRKRVTNINTDQPANEAHVAVLFSGGLDCTTLALLADRYVPSEQPIDLLNVGFENVRAIEAAKQEREKRLRSKNKPVSKKFGKGTRHPALALADNGDGATTLQDEAEEVRKEEEAESELGLLDDIYAVPDRLTGLASYRELCALAPERRWNFVAINVPYTTYTAHRAEVESLMSPTSSVMDLSIGSALYFASRARGHLVPSQTTSCKVEEEGESYTSPARVLISGLGADELLGGYSRHRQAYTRSSMAGLIDELQLDLDRLPERNLGRDDRILSCHGKEARYPYLDRSVIEFLTGIPVEAKVDVERIGTEGAGGDKRLLRDVAKDLGLRGASELKKRAMQFGTRAAKIDAESRNVKGHHKLN